MLSDYTYAAIFTILTFLMGDLTVRCVMGGVPWYIYGPASVVASVTMITVLVIRLTRNRGIR